MSDLVRNTTEEGRFGFGDWNGEPRFIVFFVPAPIALEFPDGSTFRFAREEMVDWLKGIPSAPTPEFAPEYDSPADDGKGFVSCKVWRVPEEIEVSLSEAERAIRVCATVLDLPEPPPFDDSVERRIAAEVPSLAAVFELVTPMIPSTLNGAIDKRKTVSDAFDRCIEALAELYRAYLIQTRDWRIREPTRRSITSVIPWTTRHPLLNRFDGMRLFLPNLFDTSTQLRAGTMSARQVEEVMKAVSRRRQAGEHGDPVLMSVEHARRAQRAYHIDADYLSTIVWAYAWLETLLDGILTVSAWEDGVEAREVAGWFERRFMKRVLEHFPKRFGGKWLPDVSDSYFGSWVEAVANVRHLVIHDGYRPSQEEAARALVVCERLEEYVKDRVARKRRRFPKTSLIVIGTPGLERRHLLDSYMRRVVEDASEEESWLRSYARFVTEVRGATGSSVGKGGQSAPQ